MNDKHAPLSPLGELLTISWKHHTAEIREVGASLFSYSVDGKPVVDGPSVSAEIVDVHKGSRGANLIPFPNRLEGGKYVVDGKTLQMATSGAHAMHGFVRTQRWSIDKHKDHSITLSTTLFAQVGYPFVLSASITYSLSEDGLKVEMDVTNRGERTLPLAIGVHPYFTVGSSSVDADELTVPAAVYMPMNSNEVPTGEHKKVAGTEFDFRTARSLKDEVLDVTFAGLERDDDGIAHVTLKSTETGRSVDVWMDESFDYLQAFTADTLIIPTDRRQTIALEPMTAAANAFNNGDGLQWLEPGETTGGTWGVRAF